MISRCVWPLFFLLVFAKSPLFAQEFAALLYKATGKVQVMAGEAAQGAWKNARIGMGLLEKDSIRTGESSAAYILFEDGTFFLIKENASCAS